MDDIQEIDASFLGNVTLIGEAVPARSSYDSSDANSDPEDEPDELEEDEGEDGEEEEEVDPEEDAVFEGPMTWEEVDMSELEPVMLRVTNAAMPLTDNKDLATRLEALQALYADSDNTDPLGLGKIDALNVTLVKAGDVPKERHRASRPEYKKKSSRKAENIHTIASRLMSADVDIGELRSKAMPYGENFDPDTFLGTIHSGTSLADLLKGRQNLKAEVSERTGQLKALVKENFDRFISCKNTIDDIHKRLKISEAFGSGNGTSTSDMVVVIAEVQEQASSTFKTLLDRADHSDQLKNVVALLKRYEHIFQIPARIKQGIATGNFDQVISEYKKARVLMDAVGPPKPHSLWEKLFNEIEKGIKAAVDQLESILRDTTADRSATVDSVHHILHLQSEGSPSALRSDPLMIHAEVRAAMCLEELDGLERVHEARMEAARSHDQAWNVHEDDEVPTQQVDSEADQDRMRSRSGTVLALFVKELFALGQVHVAAISMSNEGKLSQSMVAGVRERMLEAEERILPVTIRTASRFHLHTDIALKELSKSEEDKVHFMGVIMRTKAVSETFKSAGANPALLQMVQSHFGVASVQVIEQMTAKIKEITKEMPNLENFEIVPSSHKAGSPASRVPTVFRKALAASLGTLEEIVLAAAPEDEAEAEDEAFDPLQGNYSLLRRAFTDGFSSFATALDNLWALVVAKEDPQSRSKTENSANTKLLILQSNCVHLRTHVLKDLATRFQGMLTADGGFQEHRKLMGECVDDMRVLEGRLATIYIKGQVEALNEVLDEYFEDDGTDWADAPIPTGVRDCTFEIISFLAGMYAEVYTNAMSLQKRATEELVQHLFQAYHQCVVDKLEEANLGGALQLLLELQYISHGIPVTKAQRDSLIDKTKGSILAKITELTQEAPHADMQAFNSWCSRTGGTNASYRADVVSKLRSVEIADATCFNLASFKVS